MSDTYNHTWVEYKRDWIRLEGHPIGLVKTTPSLNGKYLWQHGDECSYAPTVEYAKMWVETGREIYPRRIRNLS